jgi:hypothetical protein
MGTTISPVRARSTRIAAVAAGVALAALLLGACSSGGGGAVATNVSSTGGPNTTSTAGAGGAVSSNVALPACPSAAEVNAALGASTDATGPTLSGTSVYKKCNYGNASVDISFGDASEFGAGEQAVGEIGDLTKISGLGDEAYASLGMVQVLNGSVQVEVNSAFSSQAQLTALARDVV